MSQDIVDGEFVSIFGPQYVRNNKSAGQKNLRCFPACSAAGHCRIGFCGGPVVVKATIRNPTNAPFSQLNYIAYGEFIVQSNAAAPVSTTGAARSASTGAAAVSASLSYNACASEIGNVEIGGKVTRAAIDQSTRTDDVPTGPLHKSSTVRKVSSSSAHTAAPLA